MRSLPAIIAIDRPVQPNDSCEDEVTRGLKELLCRIQSIEGIEPGNNPGSEEILVDTEVGGSRYLLLRVPKPGPGRIQLSPREQEIVRMVAKGHPNKVIADVLNISSWTVCTHLRRIFAKLGVGTRAAMVACEMNTGKYPRTDATNVFVNG